MTLYTIFYTDSIGLPRMEHTTTAGGALRRVEELEAEGYTNVTTDADFTYSA